MATFVKFVNDIEKKRTREYITQKMEEGYTEHMIIRMAKKSGWNEEVVKTLFKEAKKGKAGE